MRRLRDLARRCYRAFLRRIGPQLATKIQYLKAHRRWPNLDHPRAFSEHICALKLRGYDKLMIELSDKIAVKHWVCYRLGADWVVPSLYEGPGLPPVDMRDWKPPFVIKANHGSGLNHFVDVPENDDVKVDWSEIERKVRQWTRFRWPIELVEEWYNQIPRMILVEQRLDSGSGVPTDYKFFVFGGRIACVQVDIDRFGKHQRAFFDTNWTMLPFSMIYPTPAEPVQRPQHLEAMCWAAETLGAGFDFVRVDLYSLPDGPRFGEITFAPESGFGRVSPASFDDWLGAHWPG